MSKWITESIALPQKLVEAQEEGKLVVFAGAGISKGEPSNLPLFGRLADLIADELFVDKKKEDEHIDNYLGRLQQEGKDVKKAAAKILSKPESKYTSIHKDLFRLFSSEEEVKIITTNFDKHFSTVLREDSYEKVEKYYGPAVPLGRDFTGLVYLHGAIENNISSLVLTDSDFGRAYLSDGWATRFLKGVFDNYTVLFIGYSHDDVVMHYLARGLPPHTPRYAFTQKGKTRRWKSRNIDPIEYEISIDEIGEEDHSKLNNAISRWVTDVNKQPLEHEEKIVKIVNSKSPISPDQDSYLFESILDSSRVHFFIRHSNFDTKWLEWLERREIFSQKIAKNIDWGPFSQIVDWFVRVCITNAPNSSLKIILRTGEIDERFWNPLARRLANSIEEIEPKALSKWIAILTQYGDGKTDKTMIGLILKELKYPDHKESLLTLLSYIFIPKLKVRSTSFEEDDYENKDDSVYLAPEIFFNVKKYILDDIETLIKDNISELSRNLIPIITDSFTKTHYLWANFYGLSRQVDYISFGIPTIEKSDENEIHEEPINKIKDIGREIIEFLSNSNPDFSSIITEGWYRSDIPMLMRLAVHGKRLQNECSNSEKIIWCCRKDLILNSAVRHEIFLLLREKFPHSNRKAKSKFMKLIDEFISEADLENDEDYTLSDLHRMLRMLEHEDPSCSFVNKRLKKIHELKPDFQSILYKSESPRKFTSQPIHDISPISVSELMDKSPMEAVALFNQMKEELRNG